MEFDVWVVDNASTDRSGEMVSAEFPQVHLIPSSENVGFARANNLALKACQGDVICLLNPDTIVFPGTLTYLVDFIQRNHNAGFCGPRILNPDQTLQQSWDSFPTLLMEIMPFSIRKYLARHKLINQRYAGWTDPYQEPVIVDWVKGACLVFRRAIVDKIGALDEDFFMYAEEMDWCLRGVQAGLSTWYLPEVSIVHYDRAASSQVPARVYLDFYKSKLLFFRKHHGAITNLVLRGYLMIKCLYFALFIKRSPLLASNPTISVKEGRNLYFKTLLLAGRR